ncbi:MAG: TetR/AcrR family transcriptional regulator [Dehalobacterium sp.]
MKNLNSRQKQAQNTKRRIFDAAVSLLDEKAFGQMKIRDIIKKADISIGTFYHYYTTKMDVFYETYHVADELFENEVAPKLTLCTVQDNIMLFFDYYAKYNSEFTDFRITKLLYNTDNKFFNRNTDYGIVAVLTRLVQLGIDHKELISDPDAPAMANFLMIAARGLVYHWCTEDCTYDLPVAMQKFVLRLLKIYKP